MNDEVKTWNVNAIVVGGKWIGEIKCRRSELEGKVYGMDGAYTSLCQQCSDQVADPETQCFSAEADDGEEWDDGDRLGSQELGPSAMGALETVRQLRLMLSVTTASTTQVKNIVAFIDERHPELRDES